MTARVLTGSKQEIARTVASLEGEVRQVIVFFDEPSDRATQSVPQTVEELFREMKPFMVTADDFDDSRGAIYQRMDSE